jgi:hypothetical protein
MREEHIRTDYLREGRVHEVGCRCGSRYGMQNGRRLRGDFCTRKM